MFKEFFQYNADNEGVAYIPLSKYSFLFERLKGRMIGEEDLDDAPVTFRDVRLVMVFLVAFRTEALTPKWNGSFGFLKTLMSWQELSKPNISATLEKIFSLNYCIN
jgi:hypothetical protein